MESNRVKKSLISKKPLICTAGDRPAGVPYVSNNCKEQTARKYYEKAIREMYRSCYKHNKCVDRIWGKKEKLSAEENSTCTKMHEMCNSLYHSIPNFWRGYGIRSAFKSPFVEKLAFRMDQFGLDDLRSTGVFYKLAENQNLQRAVRRKGRDAFTILYPAGGSHLAPFVTFLRLMDLGKLSNLKIIYTEIDENSRQRMDIYLNFLASTEDLFKNFQRVLIRKNPGYEVHYRFTYNGKPVHVLYAVNRSGKKYARDEYVREADFYVIHDAGDAENFVKELRAHLVKIVTRRHTPLFVLSESGWWKNETTERYVYKGYYGCSGHIMSFSRKDSWNWRPNRFVFVSNEKGEYLLSTKPQDPIGRKSPHKPEGDDKSASLLMFGQFKKRTIIRFNPFLFSSYRTGLPGR